jgi:hypothetical protein
MPMRTYHPFMCLLMMLALARSVFAAAVEDARKPSYPIFGILQTDPNSREAAAALKGTDVFAPLCQYQMIYSSDGPALRTVRDARKTVGCNAPVLVYMGGFTTNPGGATEIEKGYRQAVAMIDVTALAASVDVAASEVFVGIAKDGELPIKAGTADLTDPRDLS